MPLTRVRSIAWPLALLALWLLAGQLAQAQQTPEHIGKTVVVDAPQDAWQKRRQQTLGWVRTFQNDKLDKNPFGITPMEAMDLLQLYYIPSENNMLESQLRIVAAVATVGWYDALRFADESGRAEIVNNEAFFKRAIFQRNAIAHDPHWPAAWDEAAARVTRYYHLHKG